MIASPRVSLLRRLLHYPVVGAGSVACTVLLFFVLPLIQAINDLPEADVLVRGARTAYVPPPDAEPPPEPEEEPEKEEEPPELKEESQPLDLSQLELALNPGGFSGGWIKGDFGVELDAISGGRDAESLFSLADLDQEPRAIYQSDPIMNARIRRKAPGKVYVLFVVNARGRVENPIIQRSTDAVFERPALAAVKKWRFEPGKRKGKPVRFRMRVPITFPRGNSK